MITSLLSKLPLDGQKTYLCVILLALVAGFGELGYLDPGSVETLTTWLTIAFGGSLAHKVSKLNG